MIEGLKAFNKQIPFLEQCRGRFETLSLQGGSQALPEIVDSSK
jgi:hypothetical protein